MSRLHGIATAFLGVAVSLWASAATAQSPARLALIIGNGGYRGTIPALGNPMHDAAAVAAMTQRLGFSTVLLLDANLSEMQAAIRALGRAANRADTVLIYYSGHGIEAAGQNYLLPVDLALRAGDGPASLAPRSLSLREIDAALAGMAATTLIFIDACRNDPFSAAATPAHPPSRGIAALPAAESGLAAQQIHSATAVLYATAPGTVALDGAGAYSPFTTALLQSFEASGRDLADLFRSVQVAVADATSNAQTPTPDRSPIPAIPLFRRAAVTGGDGRIARVATAARGGVAAGSYLGLPVVFGPAPPYFPFHCEAHAGRNWTRGGGKGTMVVNRNGPACAVQIFGYFDPIIPAQRLTVADPPSHGRMVIVGNSFAYVPNPGYAGPDHFAINAVAGGQVEHPMHGEMDVTVR